MGKKIYNNINDFFVDLGENGWKIDKEIVKKIEGKLLGDVKEFGELFPEFEYDEDVRNTFYFAFLEDEGDKTELLIDYDHWLFYSGRCNTWLCGGALIETLWIKPNGTVISYNSGIIEKKEGDFITIDFTQLKD
jgi:hypothetical protein